MKPGWAAAWLIGFGIVLSLLVAGIILLVSSQPRGEPIRLLPPPTTPPLVIQVSGAVAQPGVYHLVAGSRVLDAIQAAGGLLPDASAETINQAAPVQDGDLVWVPFKTPLNEQPPGTQAALPSRLPEAVPSAAVRFPVNINTATADDLEALPGIGTELARRIIEYRTTNGPFSDPEDIQSVDGIGGGKFEAIKDLITVDMTPPGIAP
jgi:competence protein ComEA